METKVGKGKGRYGRVKEPIMKQAATTAKIKIRLDNRTIITIKDKSAFKLWKVKYPNAEIVD